MDDALAALPSCTLSLRAEPVPATVRSPGALPADAPPRALPDEARLLRAALPLLDQVALGLWRRWGCRHELQELTAVGRAALVPLLRDYDAQRAPLEPYLAQRLAWAIRDSVRRDTHCRALTARASWGERSSEHEAALPDSQRGAGTEQPWRARWLACGALPRASVDPAELAADVGPGRSALAHDPEQTVSRKREAEQLWQAVASLPPCERALVEQHYRQEERFDLVAGQLGISKSWASRLHARALARLGHALGRAATQAPRRSRAVRYGRPALPGAAGAPAGSLR